MAVAYSPASSPVYSPARGPTERPGEVLSIGAHRYWRINITAVGSGNAAAIAELQMYESEFGPNVCTGGTASADAEFSANFAASEAFDGFAYDGSSFPNVSLWASGATALPHWLQYDFGDGNDKAIVAIGIHGRNAAQTQNMPTAFDVQYSDNGTNWTTAWSESGLSWSAFEFKRFVLSGQEASYSGSPHGSHDFWRLEVVDVETATLITSLAELELRATSGGADQCTGGTAAADATSSGRVASNAFDNNTATMWASSDKGSYEYGWIRYGFASAVEVAEAAVTARDDAFPDASPEAFAVQYADSAGGPWTTAWMVNSQTGWSASEQRVFTDPNYIAP